MDKVFSNKKHEQLAIEASKYYNITFDTFIDICKGKYLPAVKAHYFTFDNEHYLSVIHPSKPMLFVISKLGIISYYKTVKVDFKDNPVNQVDAKVN